MTNTVPTLSIIFMVISCVAGLAIPIGPFLYFRRKKGADIFPFFIGFAVFAVFVGVESVLINVLLSLPAGETILKNIWLYALLGGLLPGLFEETGRLLAFKTVLRKKQGKDVNALMYGAGHGGIEVFLVLTVTMVSNLYYAAIINSGNVAALTGGLSGDALMQVETQVQTLLASSPWQFLLGIVERVFGLGIHLSLSVLVWFAVKKGKGYLYPLAILLHAIVDAVAVMMTESGVSPMLQEGIIGIIAVVILLIAKRVWSDNADMPESQQCA